ncbi:MAG: glutamine--fructose-6-phosphate transaminase (isomerizing) [Candidatus Accumulibacter sp.]|jgi:glucosamine--fructose-6-phosphate aminotransferase (isomerizing)|nr:glutamine--fructose-6-phosphate transaminase (isomerizing) [Accumulibacter sp.]
MCGIVAAVTNSDTVPILLEGLRRLEYRGYDSAGLALVNEKGMQCLRAVGRVAELEAQVESTGISGTTGIAHTRWATHGVPCERNAHPHVSGGIAVVHNGIIENHDELRQRLKKEGFVFASDTDTEVIGHLIAFELKNEPFFFAAVRKAIARLRGAFALAVLYDAMPGRVIVAREGAPLLLGIGDSGNYAASDISALLQVTRRVIHLENGDCAEISPDGFSITHFDGTPVKRDETESRLSAEAIQLGPYRHYMQKEIFEQPSAISNTLEMLGAASSIQPGLFGATALETLDNVRQALILACGTSYHAGLVARYWLESIAGLPCSVEMASEYRYRDPVPDPQTLVITLSQSGETADTLAALCHAKSLGMTKTLCICNVPESSLVRENVLRFITRAGPEIGVASTKAFTTQLAALYLLTLIAAKLRGRLSGTDEVAGLRSIRHLPVAVSRVLGLEEEIQRWAERFAMKEHALFLGRGRHYPIAMEGALKLKEITYIHAEAYAAGELKHGPLALVDEGMPVIAVAPNDALLEKLKSNLHEVRARGGELYVFADLDSEITVSENLNVIRLPEHYGQLSALLHVIPLQLLAYHVALVRGTDVDKPRNLAKSVTVE